MASPSKRAISLRLSDVPLLVIGLISQRLILGQYPAQCATNSLAPVDELPGEPTLNEVMPPVSAWPDAFLNECRDRRLETGIVAAVRTAIVAAIDKIAFGAEEALTSLGEIDFNVALHAAQSNKLTG